MDVSLFVTFTKKSKRKNINIKKVEVFLLDCYTALFQGKGNGQENGRSCVFRFLA